MTLHKSGIFKKKNHNASRDSERAGYHQRSQISIFLRAPVQNEVDLDVDFDVDIDVDEDDYYYTHEINAMANGDITIISFYIGQ